MNTNMTGEAVARVRDDVHRADEAGLAMLIASTDALRIILAALPTVKERQAIASIVCDDTSLCAAHYDVAREYLSRTSYSAQLHRTRTGGPTDGQ